MSELVALVQEHDGRDGDGEQAAGMATERPVLVAVGERAHAAGRARWWR